MDKKRFSDQFGYVNSGSEHDAVLHHYHHEDEESLSLSDLFECFQDEDYNCCRNNNEFTERETATELYSIHGRVGSNSNSNQVIAEFLNNDVSAAPYDPYQRRLESDISQAMKALARFGSRDKQTLNRNVMYFLRKLGHNAAICKSKWESSGSSLAAGNYEFIDVESYNTSQSRYFIDLNFAAEFEIARPTEHYSKLLDSLPSVMVATEEALKKVIKVVAAEVKRSLKSRDLHLPPWRKNRYLQMKWFGPYKRTTDLFHSSSSSPSTPVNSAVILHRIIGFEVGPVTEYTHGRYTVRTRD